MTHARPVSERHGERTAKHAAPADVDHDAAPVGRTRARVTGCTSGAPGVVDQSIDAETAQIQETMLPALLEFVAAAADEPAQPTEPGRLEWDA